MASGFAEKAFSTAANGGRVRADELRLASRVLKDGFRQVEISVPTMHCGGCMQKVEKGLAKLPGVSEARVNLTSKRVTVRWQDEGVPPPLVETLHSLGFEAHLTDAKADAKDHTFSELLRALAIAGFAAGNIMMLSVSVWTGADPATRDLFHWISAAIAVPALVYSGRIFFRSAWGALRRGHTNMDVPISIGVLLAFGLSLYETIHHGSHAYFDAAASLLFFLLIGRTLDHLMRERARTAVTGLANLAARGALVLRPDGTRVYTPVDDLKPGMTIQLSAGERIPVDARVISGQSNLDCSLVTGESLPRPASAGMLLQAGTMNLTGPLTIEAMSDAKDSFLAEMVRMMEAAEAGRSGFRRISDRAAQLYAPAVHTAAFLTFVGWMIATGDVHRAITVAIAVLIITCPCALGLAVPMVQVVAARRLFEKGILLKDGGALERLAEIDTVVLDKTGTLTLGAPRLLNGETLEPAIMALAARIAVHSQHPYARALAAFADGTDVSLLDDARITEVSGAGLEAHIGEHVYRLGRPSWAVAERVEAGAGRHSSNVVLSKDGKLLGAFEFSDPLRDGAAETLQELKQSGIAIEILSGDRAETVRRVAESLGIAFSSDVRPDGKVAHIGSLQDSGRKVLMVGDGLNDAPALVAAHASMAPASAADIGRNAADLVFLHESLMAVPQAFRIALSARKLVYQNLALAVIYNLCAVPIAIAGFVTPLVAAIAMSLSSLLVVANALRLRDGGRLGYFDAKTWDILPRLRPVARSA
ncbi:cation-translocating P-type ATPase [Hyphomicrobium denitrificans]|nr:cation-translocating P-type ATPase [Hyphomicrobium denitrificans]